MIVPCFFSQEILWIFVGMVISALIILAIMYYCFPIWFKAYYDLYNLKEGGVSNEDKSIKESNKESSNTN